MPFEFRKLAIPDIILIKPKRFEDKRGFFMETYKKSDFQKAGIHEEFVQDNYSRSTKGVLRGLHFQNSPKAQAKLIHCIVGKVFDVAVDIRENSPYFGQWVGEYLSAKNGHILYVPIGFAHGFLALSEGTEIVYKVSEEYSPEHEGGIIWNDPDIGIDWPLKNSPIVSEKDRNLSCLKRADYNFNYEEC